MVKTYQSGAVSIFAVIFSTLLLTVLTVGFIGIMITAQQRAINNDLSQSAYDAALAGVEDAKRTVRACAAGDAAVCNELAQSNDCRVIARAGINGVTTDSETLISSNVSGDGTQFNQAYTCVDIDMDSNDYLYEASPNRSHVVPLRSTSDIRSIVVEWYSETDSGGVLARAPTTTGNDRLPTQANWRSSSPPLLRAQLITPGESFDIGSLDSSNASRTFFFRPTTVSSATGGTNHQVDMDHPDSFARVSEDGEFGNSMRGVTCSASFRNNGYSCRVTIALSDETVIPVSASQNALMRLETIYGAASVRVSMRSADGSVAQFDGVQPVVDSTGRASDLFRRVEARLRMGSDVQYPSYVADLESLCKNFSVTDVRAYSSCNP